MPQPIGPRLAARDAFMYAAGIGFLFLAKIKNVLQGYSTPKGFELSETDRAVAYDLKVVDEWLMHLNAYAGGKVDVLGKNVLELGPGSDLGVGIYLLSKGAAAYNACDVNDLIKRAPASFYTALIERIGALDPDVDRSFLTAQLESARNGTTSRLRTVVRDDFDLVAAFGADSIDLVFSQAAFEHFDDVARTVQLLTVVCKPGTTIVAEIDLKTHSRWIRVKDPNNIYRYPNWLYRLFWFRGTPNRVRPYQYKKLFEQHGWTRVSITPTEHATGVRGESHGMDGQFRGPNNELEYLSVVLCATKPLL